MDSKPSPIGSEFKRIPTDITGQKFESGNTKKQESRSERKKWQEVIAQKRSQESDLETSKSDLVDAQVETSTHHQEFSQASQTVTGGYTEPGLQLAQASSAGAQSSAASGSSPAPTWGWVVGIVSVGAIASQGSTSTSPVPASVSGTAIDGYISGADVFLVSGGQKTKVGTTDANGKFTIQNPTSALIQVEGGTNKDTGLPNTVLLKAPPSTDGTIVVTPLTTLIHTKMVELGVSAQAAEATVREKLGITGDVSLLTLDSIATENVAVQKANVLIATAMKQADSTTEADQILKELATTLATSTGQIDLTNTLVDVVRDKVPSSVLNSLNDQLKIITTATNISEIGNKQKDAIEALDKVTSSASGGNTNTGGGSGGGSGGGR